MTKQIIPLLKVGDKEIEDFEHPIPVSDPVYVVWQVPQPLCANSPEEGVIHTCVSMTTRDSAKFAVSRWDTKNKFGLPLLSQHLLSFNELHPDEEDVFMDEFNLSHRCSLSEFREGLQVLAKEHNIPMLAFEQYFNLV